MQETLTTPARLKKSTIVRSSPWAVAAIQRLVLGGLRTFFTLVGRRWPGPASHVAEALFLRPPQHATPSREREWLASAERFEVESAGGPLTAWSWSPTEQVGAAEAPTVLLVHGWAGRGSQLAAFAAPLTGAGYRVVAFDAPGHGRTARRQGVKRSSMPEMVDGILALAARLGPLAGVIAHSAGAGAVGYALRRGLETERLVFVAPGVEPSLFTEGLRRLIGIPQPVLDRMRERLEARFGVRWEDFRAATFAPQRTERLLILHDRLDEEVPCWHSRELVEAWPGARLEVVSGLGHRRILRDPQVVERTTRFLAGRSEAREEAAA